MDDSEGRWWSFVVKLDSLLILEKGSTPTHLQSMGCLDSCSTFAQALRELEDLGEAELFTPRVFVSFVLSLVSLFQEKHTF